MLPNCFELIFIHLKQNLLTQVPASNDEKMSIYVKWSSASFQCHFILSEITVYGSSSTRVKLMQTQCYRNGLEKLVLDYRSIK